MITGVYWRSDEIFEIPDEIKLLAEHFNNSLFNYPGNKFFNLLFSCGIFDHYKKEIIWVKIVLMYARFNWKVYLNGGSKNWEWDMRRVKEKNRYFIAFFASSTRFYGSLALFYFFSLLSAVYIMHRHSTRSSVERLFILVFISSRISFHHWSFRSLLVLSPLPFSSVCATLSSTHQIALCLLF